MSIHFTPCIGADRLGDIEILRVVNDGRRDATDPDAINGYQVTLTRPGTHYRVWVQHRYGDGWLALVAKATAALQESQP